MSNLTEFISWWISLFSHSPKSKLLWKAQTGKAMTTFSATHWWSKFEVMKQLLEYFEEIEPFLRNNTDIGPSLRPKLLGFLGSSQKKVFFQIELAAVVDWGQHFVTACYTLEGDGPLVLSCYETINRIISAIQANNSPNVCALARSLCGQHLLSVHFRYLTILLVTNRTTHYKIILNQH